MVRFLNRNVLVTGAQQGIGRAIAIRFARENAAIAVNVFDDRTAALDVLKTIRKMGNRVHSIQADVSRADDAMRMVDDAERAIGPLSVLVNNAGIFPRVPLLEMSEEQWDRVLDVNLKGTFLCSQAFARRLVERRQRGAIVSIASLSAYRPSARGAHYAASKAGIIGFTRALALELAPYGIRANAVAPGLTDTAQPRDGMSEDEVQAAARQVPLGRMATPEDIAATVAFLASDDAAHITGQVVHVNGGSYLG